MIFFFITLFYSTVVVVYAKARRCALALALALEAGVKHRVRVGMMSITSYRNRSGRCPGGLHSSDL